jgi:hypothetical protein
VVTKENDVDEELRELREENGRLRRENEILWRAVEAMKGGMEAIRKGVVESRLRSVAMEAHWEGRDTAMREKVARLREKYGEDWESHSGEDEGQGG